MIQIHNVSKSYPSKIIYDQASVTIYENEKVGLIGKNGTGKSTLFEMICDQISFEGQININKNIKLGYYTQNIELDETLTVNETLYKPFEHLFKLEAKMLELSYDFENNVDEYNKILAEFEDQDGYFITSNINEMINVFKLRKLLNAKISTLSGGERGRIALTSLLLSKPDILLLDEPLNHLDLEGITWLEGFLQKYNSTFIVISHDKYFLNNVCNNIVEVKHQKLKKYSGNYDAFLKQTSHNQLTVENEYEKQQTEINKLKGQIKQYRIWGESRSSEKMFKKAKELEKRLAKIDVIDNPNKTDKNVKLNFKNPSLSGYNVVWLENASFGYDNKPLYSNVNLNIYRNDKIAFVGANGTGKSTLLKIIANKLSLLEGTCEIGSNVKMSYFDQVFENLDKNNTIIEEIHKDNILLTNFEIRKHLAKFMFTNDDLNKKVSTLSGGECVRLSFAKLTVNESNLLILDEPTNHLDLESQDIIEEALKNYDGTIIFSSHSRSLINSLSNKIVEFNKDQLNIIDKEYVDYLVERDLVFNQETKVNSNNNYEEQKRLKSKENKKVKLELKIQEKETYLKELEEQKFNPDIYTNEDNYLHLKAEIKSVEKEIEILIESFIEFD